ncbi:hypothetical protein VTO73DRAFT_9027 [Trametes versicolor]
MRVEPPDAREDRSVPWFESSSTTVVDTVYASFPPFVGKHASDISTTAPQGLLLKRRHHWRLLYSGNYLLIISNPRDVRTRHDY